MCISYRLKGNKIVGGRYCAGETSMAGAIEYVQRATTQEVWEQRRI
jgi:hypothetical protein